jgi:hypothetical protein
VAASGYLIDHATEIRLRAERRLGQLLRDMPKNKGTRSQLVSRGVIGGAEKEPPINRTPTLADLGITKDESSKWQKLAALDQAQFEETVAASLQRAVAGILAAAIDLQPFRSQTAGKILLDRCLLAALAAHQGISVDSQRRFCYYFS